MMHAASRRRFDVLGGPGGYVSARHVGEQLRGLPSDKWQVIARVNVPRRFLFDVPRGAWVTDRNTLLSARRVVWAYAAILRLYGNTV